MSNELEIQRWATRSTAELVKEIIKGNTNTAEAARIHDLMPAKVESWVNDAIQSMENALKANPKDMC